MVSQYHYLFCLDLPGLIECASVQGMRTGKYLAYTTCALKENRALKDNCVLKDNQVQVPRFGISKNVRKLSSTFQGLPTVLPRLCSSLFYR